MIRLIKFFALILIMMAPMTALASNNQIHIDSVSEAEFDVLYHRVGTNATGAAIGGLLGAGIQAGIESSKDAEKRGLIEPHISEDLWQLTFVKTLEKKLTKSGFLLIEQKASDTKTLKIYPETYGFKVVDSNTMLMSAFVSFKAQVVIGNKTEEKESFYIIHKDKQTFNDITNSPTDAKEALENVLLKGARRLANKVIYQSKEN